MILYKYTRADIALNILRSRLIRFTQLAALNDPFEAHPPVSGLMTEQFLLENLERLLADEALLLQVVKTAVAQSYSGIPTSLKSILTIDQVEAMVWEILSQNGSTLQESLRHIALPKVPQALQDGRSYIATLFPNLISVLSLSVVPNNEVMWSHYADAHCGVVLGFDSADPFLSDVIRVKYQTERPLLDMAKRPTDASVWKEAQEVLCGIKNEAWSYEQEYRLVIATERLIPTQEVDSRGFPVFVQSFSPAALVEVIFGSQINSEHSRALRRELEKPDLSHVKALCESLDLGSHSVSIQECGDRK